MKHIFQETGVIILAGGRGSRLNCKDYPKVLCLLAGKPMLTYILDTLERIGLRQEQICIVVGHRGEEVKKVIGGNYLYAWQERLGGTAHAASAGERILPSEFKNLLVLNGDDSAFYTSKTLKIFVSQHIQNKNDISMLTCEVDDPAGMGRVVRNVHNNVVKIVEKENVAKKEENIKEINTGTFCFYRDWFRYHYQNLEKIPGLEEVGLPSLIDEALSSDSNLRAVKLADTTEWMGINTEEELKLADKKMKKRLTTREKKTKK